MGFREVSKEMTVGSSIGPTASESGCVSWKGGRVDLHVYGLDPGYLNAGFIKPRRGFTLVAGEEKPGVGKESRVLDKILLCDVEKTVRKIVVGLIFKERNNW